MSLFLRSGLGRDSDFHSSLGRIHWWDLKNCRGVIFPVLIIAPCVTIREFVHYVDAKQAKLLRLAEQGKINGTHLLDGDHADKG